MSSTVILNYVFLIGFLAFLEGILSVDNALVLAMMAKHLPKDQQKKALTYGLVGAVVFRLIALSFAAYLIQYRWVKFVGGGYLLYVAIAHFIKKSKEDSGHTTKNMGFWHTVMMIELMDIAFAVDSILAAVALSSKFWIVFTGGMIGVVLMRYAATGFLTLLKRFPRFEDTAYQLILLIGIKLVIDGFHFHGIEFESPRSVAFWIFWSSMALCIFSGFRKKPSQSA